MGNDNEKRRHIDKAESPVDEAALKLKLAEGALASARLAFNIESQRAKAARESEILSLASQPLTADQIADLVGLFGDYVGDYYFSSDDQYDQNCIIGLQDKLTPREPILVTSEDGISFGYIAKPDAEEARMAVPVIDRSEGGAMLLRLRWSVALDDGSTVLTDGTTAIGEEMVSSNLENYVANLRRNRNDWTSGIGDVHKALVAFGNEDITVKYEQLAMSDADAALRVGDYYNTQAAISGIYNMGNEGLYVDIFSRVVDEIKNAMDDETSVDRGVRLVRALMTHLIDVNGMKRPANYYLGPKLNSFADTAEPAVYRLLAELLETATAEDSADIVRIIEAVRGFIGADEAEAADVPRLF